jgi:hypothetical protein
MSKEPKTVNSPKVVFWKLPDSLAGYNKDFSTVYMDEMTPFDMIPHIMVHETREYNERNLNGLDYEKAHVIATQAEHEDVEKAGQSWDKYNKTFLSLLPKITARGGKNPPDLVKTHHRL